MQPSNLVNKGSEEVQVQGAPFNHKVRRAWQGLGSCRSLRLSWLSVAAELVVVVIVSIVESTMESSSTCSPISSPSHREDEDHKHTRFPTTPDDERMHSYAKG
jgi:hypothetical protein